MNHVHFRGLKTWGLLTHWSHYAGVRCSPNSPSIQGILYISAFCVCMFYVQLLMKILVPTFLPRSNWCTCLLSLPLIYCTFDRAFYWNKRMLYGIACRRCGCHDVLINEDGWLSVLAACQLLIDLNNCIIALLGLAPFCTDWAGSSRDFWRLPATFSFGAPSLRSKFIVCFLFVCYILHKKVISSIFHEIQKNVSKSATNYLLQMTGTSRCE